MIIVPGHVGHMGEGRGYWCGNLRERDHWGDPDVVGRIILRWIFRKWEGLWGLAGVGSGQGEVVGTCEYGNELSGFVKCEEFLD